MKRNNPMIKLTKNNRIIIGSNNSRFKLDNTMNAFIFSKSIRKGVNKTKYIVKLIIHINSSEDIDENTKANKLIERKITPKRK